MDNSLVEVYPLYCPDCKGTDCDCLGVRDGYLYVSCLGCGATIRWDLSHLTALSYLPEEGDIDLEQIHFNFPKTNKGNGSN